MKHIIFLLILVTSIACNDLKRKKIYVISNKEKTSAYIPSAYTVGDTVIVYFDFVFKIYEYVHNPTQFETTSMASNDFTTVYYKAVILE